MCIHHRLIYRKCGHFTWLGITKKCQAERSFDQGKTDEGCNVMWTHPLSTYRVDRCCESCALKRATMDRAIDEIRERIQVTRELLAKIQEASKGLKRSPSEGVSGYSSVKEAEVDMVEDYEDGGDEDDDKDIEEAETMDLIDPSEMIKKDEQFVGGISIGLQSLESPNPPKRRFERKKLKIEIRVRNNFDIKVDDRDPLYASDKRSAQHLATADDHSQCSESLFSADETSHELTMSDVTP